MSTEFPLGNREDPVRALLSALRDRDDREAHLPSPSRHDCSHGLLARFLEGVPQVLGESVTILMFREVHVHPLPEIL